MLSDILCFAFAWTRAYMSAVVAYIYAPSQTAYNPKRDTHKNQLHKILYHYILILSSRFCLYIVFHLIFLFPDNICPILTNNRNFTQKYFIDFKFHAIL